ncbi:hypothetical protein EFA69_06490 [Rufibacter immobilis]|uniref:Uncharacterized protein n=1 Tax=Rufibacter immobilis TaxID=1348778 RepID=A0A3M9N0M0_9BACT|nr:hypothetical protein [Rufibacter immobilis]RNI30935.1 hypothetical protein EFA69_06490 [Rufibacter immobilis]
MFNIIFILQKLFLPVPFPQVFIWWVILGSILGCLFFGASYFAALGVIPVSLVGLMFIIRNKRKANKDNQE